MVIESLKQEKVKRFKLIKKAIELHKENEKLVNKIWLVIETEKTSINCQMATMPSFPMAIRYRNAKHCTYKYAMYSLEGEQLTEFYEMEY